jgi:hypothetical protein
MSSEETNLKQVTVEVPEERLAEFHMFFGRFLAGGLGRRGGPGRRGRHGRHGHPHRHCGHHREGEQTPTTDIAEA